MNFGTMAAHLLREMRIDWANPPSKTATDVRIYICRACLQCSRYVLPFNFKSEKTSVWSGDSRVSLPIGFVHFLSPLKFVTSGGAITEIHSASYPSSETKYLIRGGEFLLDPPISADGELHFDYLADIGFPTYRLDISSNEMKFYDSLTGSEVGDSYSNGWFDNGIEGGYDLILFRAAMMAWSGQFGGSEEAGNSAASYAAQFKAELARLQSILTQRHAPSSITRWI